MENQLSKEKFDGWKETVVSVLLDSNKNCRQDAFRRILNSVNVYANLQITIIEPRQRVGVKVTEIKMLPKTGENKIRLLTDWVNENVVDELINKAALLDPWRTLFMKEEQENKKSCNWLSGSGAKKILAKMMHDSVSEIKDRHGIINMVINKAKAIIADIKKAETINKTIEGASDGGSVENYKIVEGKRIPDSLAPLHERIIGRSFTLESLQNNAELHVETYLSYNRERYINVLEEGVISIRR